MEEPSLEERIHYLRTYTELVLYKQIEINKSQKKETIDKFIENLPPYLKVENCRTVVEETLARLEKNLKAIERDRAKEKSKQNREHDEEER